MFRYDGPFVTFLMKLGDMIILHLLWLACCLPVVTAGPATAAAHYVALKLVRDEGTSVIKMFFHGFIKNFRQAVILGVISTAVGAVLALDIWLCVHKLGAGGGSGLLLLSGLVFLSLIYLIVMLYLWAVLVRFDNTVCQVLVNSFLIAAGSWGDTSVLLLQDIVLLAAAVVSFVFLPQAAVLFAIFGVPLFFVVNAFRLRRVLERYGDGISQGVPEHRADVDMI